MSDVVRQIKERLNIVDVVSPYVELHKAGRNFKGKSPFSNERTPSFYVSPERGMYYCFSTSQGGDIFSFIQTIEGVDFREALKMLAEKAGVELVPEAPEKRSERDRLYSLLEATTKFFEGWLPQAPVAVKYLEERGVKPVTISKWRIGFAPGPTTGGWRLLKDHLTKMGYTVPEMLKAGVIKHSGDGKDPFDVFRDRVMFPLRDAQGNVVGFSGRTLAPDEKTPKYVNSPETELYKKSDLLFGYDIAKHAMRTLDFSLIVEGQFDVVMSHQAGYSNAVAVSGTALTLHHVQLLERLSRKVVLALDADRAGIAAMKRAADLMLRRGFDVKVAQLPAGSDPADLVRSDVAALKQAVGRAVPVIEFLLSHVKLQGGDERAFRLRVSEEVLPYIILIPNRIDQEHFMTVVAQALGVSLDAVRFEVERIRQDAERDRSSRAEAEVPKETVPVSPPRPHEQREHFIDWLVAAATTLGEPLATRAQAVISDVIGIPFSELLQSREPTSYAKAVIDFERRVDGKNMRTICEDIAHTLTLVRNALIRAAITERRAQLRALETGGTGDQAVILAELAAWEARRREPPITVDLFTTEGGL
jgi:DNA primase